MTASNTINETERTAIVHQVLDGLRTQNRDLLKTSLTDDAIWSIPGTSLISGEARGIEAIVGRAKRLADFGLTISLKMILLGSHGVLISLHNQAHRGLAALDESVAVVCQLRDGKICALDSYVSDLEMINSFFV